MRKRLERLTLATLAMVLVVPVLADISQSEHDALMAFYSATGGANWTFNDGWGGALGTEDTWYGVWLDSTGTTVEALMLWENNLTGSIPSQVGLLTNLKTLDLSMNSLTGSLPSQLSSCTGLTECILFDNMLSGAIPPQLGTLIHLEILDLSENRFSGAIPAEIGGATALKYLRVNGNALEGALPSQLLSLTNLVDDQGLNMRYNALTSSDSALKDFLDTKQVEGDWESYQTVAPDNLTVFEPSASTLWVSWNSIAYTQDSGYYEVFRSTASGGPYSSCGSTYDKEEASLLVSGLSPSTTYYFVVRTVTTGNTHNQNTLVSGYSPEASGTTTAAPEPLAAVATASPTAGGAPLEVQFSYVFTGGTPPISAVSWTFGDGGTSAEDAPKHTYSATGTYSVGLTITDSQNQKATDSSLQITVAPPCTLSCTATVPSTAPPGTEVSFAADATTSGCTGSPAYAWAFGDGGTSTEQNPKHTYAITGDYTWSLGVSIGDRVCTQTGTIEVLLPPTIAALKKMGDPFRIKITGSNFQPGVKVYINGTEWTNVKVKSTAELLLKQGASLKAAVPKNTPTQFKVANTDGGEATMTWQWP